MSRDADKLQRAHEEIYATGPMVLVDTVTVDAAGGGRRAFAAGLVPTATTTVVSAAGRAPHGPVAELEVADAENDGIEVLDGVALRQASDLPRGRRIDNICCGRLNRRPGRTSALAATTTPSGRLVPWLWTWARDAW